MREEWKERDAVREERKELFSMDGEAVNRERRKVAGRHVISNVYSSFFR